jgi:histidyl-tRNA synthetase
VFVAFQMAEARSAAFRLASDLRRAGIAAVVAAGERSLKAQMRQADALGAEYAAVIGRRELAEGAAALRRLSDGHQETVPQAEVAERITRSS